MSKHKIVLLALTAVLALLVPIGIHQYVGYEARHFGREAANEAVARADRANFAESEWNKLLNLARDEDFRSIIEEQFADQCIDANYFIRLIIQSRYGQTDSELADVLAELLPEPATDDECVVPNEDNHEAQPEDN